MFNKLAHKIGKLKKPFKPFTIEIPVNSPEEYWEIWHRINAHYTHFDNYRAKTFKHAEQDELTHIKFGTKNSHKLWKYVDRYRRKPWNQLSTK